MPLSAKEQEILDKQRRLAAQIGTKPKPPPPPSSSSARKPPPPPGSRQRPSMPIKKKPPDNANQNRPGSSKIVSVAQLTKSSTAQRPTTSSSQSTKEKSKGIKKPPPPPPATSTLKRPTKKRPASAMGGTVMSATALVAAARAKVATKEDTNRGSVGGDTSNKQGTGNGRPSPRVQRKSVTVSGGSSLAKLVQNVKANTQQGENDDAELSSTLQTVRPDDFWKHLRSWDFVSQYAEMVQPDTVVSSTPMQTKKSLPDIFLNARHYMAAWAPLCMAECRAQLLQEFGTNNNNKSIETVLVSVESTSTKLKKFGRRGGPMITASDDAPWMEENETGGHVLLRPKERRKNADSNRGSWSFMANDVCLLLLPKYKNILDELQATGSISSVPDGDFSKCGFVGHTESSRSDLNGLILKVSKRQWLRLGQDEMYFVKIGSNVTALREFTALSGVETLPMKRYLLGRHLEGTAKLSSSKQSQVGRGHHSADELLNKMGGSQALGKGFISYARKKFNASQLTAIAASALEYGDGGFTLIKGPPGTGKTTTLVAVLNSLHIRQFNKYYDEVRRIASLPTGTRQSALEVAKKAKPRLLVCAPSNAAVDNIILKIMENGFIDGQGMRYNPSMVRVGVGQSNAVRAVSLETTVDAIFAEHQDTTALDSSIKGYKMELSRITQDIAKLRRRAYAIATACPWPLARDWEIRVDEETFDEEPRVYFVNHKEKMTTYDVPPPPEPDETHFPAKSMPEYRSYMSRIVKLVENYFSVKSHLEQCTIVKASTNNGARNFEIQQDLEQHVLNSVHIVMTTLGTAGSRTLEGTDKFEVVVVDEAAQSVEPATLSALRLGSRHCVLVGDPQQLPATIFNVSGRNSKYDRSLFQRLEEAGQEVFMLAEQYRMHPKISHFPRHIFYGGNLLDGPNVTKPDYGDPLRGIVCRAVPTFQPLTILDLDSKEERGGTSLSNSAEAQLAVFLYEKLKEMSDGLSSKSRVAVITPYAQQARLLRKSFTDALGQRYTDFVEVNTVDAFQGREANIVIFSAVRAAGSHGIGFLSDVRRMNVALTRAKHFLFVIARCQSIVVNPYWNDLVEHARETKAVVRVPMTQNRGPMRMDFGSPTTWPLEQESLPPADPRKRQRKGT